MREDMKHKHIQVRRKIRKNFIVEDCSGFGLEIMFKTSKSLLHEFCN